MIEFFIIIIIIIWGLGSFSHWDKTDSNLFFWLSKELWFTLSQQNILMSRFISSLKMCFKLIVNYLTFCLNFIVLKNHFGFQDPNLNSFFATLNPMADLFGVSHILIFYLLKSICDLRFVLCKSLGETHLRNSWEYTSTCVKK